jgi:hypothetical protein
VPAQQQPAPLALNAMLQPISVVPSVNPPAPPPVNPAPPAGGAARKEAKQRQAAAAKSEDGATEGSGDASKLGGDLADGRVGTTDPMTRHTDAMTRHDGPRPAPSFTPLRTGAGAGPAWARGALYGGGLGLVALAFTAAWLGARPRPRRRTPVLPAPAWGRIRRR